MVDSYLTLVYGIEVSIVDLNLRVIMSYRTSVTQTVMFAYIREKQF